MNFDDLDLGPDLPLNASDLAAAAAYRAAAAAKVRSALREAAKLLLHAYDLAHGIAVVAASPGSKAAAERILDDVAAAMNCICDAGKCL